VRRPLPLLFAFSVALLLAACGGGTPGGSSGGEETISREAFIDVYVDLRVAALRTPGGEITPEERRRVLREHGVGEEDLVRFVEVHGRESAFMRELWLEARERLDSVSRKQEPSAARPPDGTSWKAHKALKQHDARVPGHRGHSPGVDHGVLGVQSDSKGLSGSKRTS